MLANKQRLQCLAYVRDARHALNMAHQDAPYADHSATELRVLNNITGPILRGMRANAILEAAAMPTWEQCKNKYDSGAHMSPLETMIYFYENAGHESAELFREHLRLLLTDHINAATAPYME